MQTHNVVAVLKKCLHN